MQFYIERIFPLLKPHQRVWIIPGLFGNSNESGDAGNHSVQQSALLQSLGQCTTWFFGEPRIAAMAPYHWFHRAAGAAPEFSLGVSEFPQVVESLRSLGHRLKGGNGTALSPVTQE